MKTASGSVPRGRPKCKRVHRQKLRRRKSCNEW